MGMRRYASAAEEIAAEQALEQGLSKVRRKPPAVPPPSEVGLLLRVAALRGYVYYVILRLFYAAGLRLGEMVHLRMGDILWEENTLFVRSGKGEKDRYVLVDPGTLRHVRQLHGPCSPETPVMERHPKTLERIFQSCAQEAGLYQKYQLLGQTLSPHSFRHAFATHCYENRMDMYALARLLGHEFLATTAIYTKTATRQWQEDYALSDPEGEAPGWGRSHTPLHPAQGDEESVGPLSYYDEIQFEFSGQCSVDKEGPDELPTLASHLELSSLLQQAAIQPSHHLMLQVLYSTGIFLEELLALQADEIDGSHARLQVGRPPRRRWVMIQPEVLTSLQSWAVAAPGPRLFPMTATQAEAMIDDYARQSGVQQRFAAIGRRFTSASLRAAFAAHRCADGMDVISLMNQLGHKYYSTTANYLDAGVLRWLPNYRASHELWLQPEFFEADPGVS